MIWTSTILDRHTNKAAVVLRIYSYQRTFWTRIFVASTNAPQHSVIVQIVSPSSPAGPTIFSLVALLTHTSSQYTIPAYQKDTSCNKNWHNSVLPAEQPQCLRLCINLRFVRIHEHVVSFIEQSPLPKEATEKLSSGCFGPVASIFGCGEVL